MTGRDAALSALRAWRRDGAWADSYLRNTDLDSREAGLARQLCYGVIQNKLLIDHYIESISTVPLKKMEPALPDILRLGVYQIMFMDKIPHSAAVNEAVRQTNKKCSKRASGLCNALLRNISRLKDTLPKPAQPHVLYSHPKWLYDKFVEVLGQREAEQLMAANNAPPPIYAQVNTVKSSVSAVRAMLDVDKIEYREKDGTFEITGAGDPGAIMAFRKGAIYIQDNAARLAVQMAAPKPGMTVIDACAAPGGKSFAAAMHMDNKGSILSCDIHENKLGQIERGAKRLGIDIITTRCANASVYDGTLDGRADLVIADVPCSGLGVIRKKPDIRYKDPGELKNLPGVQFNILKNVSRYVKPGGRLLYSTCTILPEENGAVTKRFLMTADFEKEAERTLYPHSDGCDGFYICVMRRRR